MPLVVPNRIPPVRLRAQSLSGFVPSWRQVNALKNHSESYSHFNSPISTLQEEKGEESLWPPNTAAPRRTGGGLVAEIGLILGRATSCTAFGLGAQLVVAVVGTCQQGGSSIVGTQDVVWTCWWRTSA